MFKITLKDKVYPSPEEIKIAIKVNSTRAGKNRPWWHKDKEVISYFRRNLSPDEYYDICTIVYQFTPVWSESMIVSIEDCESCNDRHLYHKKHVEIVIDPFNHKFKLYLLHTCKTIWDQWDRRDWVDESKNIMLLDDNLKHDDVIQLACKYHKCLVVDDEENLRYKAFKSE